MRQFPTSFSDILNIESRWPKKGDRLLRASNDPQTAATFAAHQLSRDAFIWDGYMTAGAALIDEAERRPHQRFTLGYPILFNYHGVNRLPNLPPGNTGVNIAGRMTFGPHRFKANGKWYLSASPSKKSIQRLKTEVRRLLVPSNIDPWDEVRDTLNRSLLGWSNYFSFGTRSSAYRAVDQYVYERVRDFLARRHKVAGRGTRRFSLEVVPGECGLLRLERLPRIAVSNASR
jgi:hypothetical protein